MQGNSLCRWARSLCCPAAWRATEATIELVQIRADQAAATEKTGTETTGTEKRKTKSVGLDGVRNRSLVHREENW